MDGCMRELKYGGREVCAESKMVVKRGMPASANRLRDGLVRKPPMQILIAEFQIRLTFGFHFFKVR